MDKLKELLGDLFTSEIEAKIGDKKFILDDGSFIPKHRLDEVIGQKKTAEEMNTKYEDDLKVLKRKAEGNEGLTAKIDEQQTANKVAKENAEKEALTLRKTYAVSVGLLDAGVSDPDARSLLSKAIDIDAIELDADGKPVGFAEKIAPLKEKKVFQGMFGETKIVGQDHVGGITPTPLSKLESKLIEAQKAGKLVEVIALKRQIVEEQNK